MPAFPDPLTVERILVAAPRGLVEGQIVELQPVPPDMARQLVAHVRASCPVWRSDFGGFTAFTRPTFRVTVYFEAGEVRLLRLGLSKDGAAHDTGKSEVYCYWEPEAYEKAIRELGLR